MTDHAADALPVLGPGEGSLPVDPCVPQEQVIVGGCTGWIVMPLDDLPAYQRGAGLVALAAGIVTLLFLLASLVAACLEAG